MSHQIDGYNYYISNESDDECRGSDSSEDPPPLDEVNIFLNGTSKQRQRALQRLAGNEASSSEDEFEAEMRDELENKIKNIKTTWTKDDKNEASSSSKQQKESLKEYYNDIYFDSDEDTENKKVGKRRKSNDELFYDPNADEKDQNWVDKQRLRGSAVKENKKTKQKEERKNEMLSCPACLTTLCIDCQKHEKYPNQYRAMFVMNCKVIRDQKVTYKEPKKKIFKRKRKISEPTKNAETPGSLTTKLQPSDNSATTDNFYNLVNCASCDTEVAVYDNDEVYHFFNVITGQP